jgi:hypothetical protein
MLDRLEHSRSLGNGKDRQQIALWSSRGLGNTNPSATLAPTSLVDPRITSGAPASEAVQNVAKLAMAKFGTRFDVMIVERTGALLIVETKVSKWAEAVKPAGQVVLFRKVMQDWNFNDEEAAKLLGYEAASDISEIYTGIKAVRHRDANDRLRAVLRIATDLHDLFQEVAKIRGWLSEPQRDLDGATPRSLLTEGSMENLLRVKSYVAYLSGR